MSVKDMQKIRSTWNWRTSEAFFRKAEIHTGTEKGFSYLYLSAVQTEDPDPKGKRKDQYPLSKMWSGICKEKLRPPANAGFDF